MDYPLFSINIPAYNCGELIYSALASVQSQSFTDWEIVIVDDGSSDDTLRVCTNQSIVPWEKIKIIPSSHSGQYITRKKLRENSLGEYIISLDADDELIGPNALLDIAMAISNSGCDVVLFNATRSLDSMTKFVDYGCLDADGNTMSSDKALAAMACSYSLNNICFKAYKKELWNPRQRDRVLENTEDRLQCGEIIAHASQCYLLDEPLYYYRPNPSSVTNSSIPFKFLEDLVYVEDSLESQFDGLRINEKKRIDFLNGIFLNLLRIILSSCPNQNARRELYKSANELRANSKVYSSLPFSKDLYPKLCMVLLDRDNYQLLDLLIRVRSLI